MSRKDDRFGVAMPPPLPPGVAGGLSPHALAAGCKFCFVCGIVLDRRAELCPHCGVRQMMPPGHGGRDKVVAGLLALLLGGLGVHKFYLGRTGWGIVYLLFCWTFIPALIALVEGIVYLCMSRQSFDARYNRPN